MATVKKVQGKAPASSKGKGRSTGAFELEVTFDRAAQLEKSIQLLETLAELSPQGIDVLPGPPALEVAGIRPVLVMTRAAWPHLDDSFEGVRFYTLVVQGKGYTFGHTGSVLGLPLVPGDVLSVDPLELHWLQPSQEESEDAWLALQWEVPLGRESAFEQALGLAFERWARPDFTLPVLRGVIS